MKLEDRGNKKLLTSDLRQKITQNKNFRPRTTDFGHKKQKQ